MAVNVEAVDELSCANVYEDSSNIVAFQLYTCLLKLLHPSPHRCMFVCMLACLNETHHMWFFSLFSSSSSFVVIFFFSCIHCQRLMFVCLLFPLVSALLLSPCGLESVVRGLAGINLGNLISGPVFTALNISISLGWLTGQQLGSSEARHMFNKQISQSSWRMYVMQKRER